MGSISNNSYTNSIKGIDKYNFNKPESTVADQKTSSNKAQSLSKNDSANLSNPSTSRSNYLKQLNVLDTDNVADKLNQRELESMKNKSIYTSLQPNVSSRTSTNNVPSETITKSVSIEPKKISTQATFNSLINQINTNNDVHTPNPAGVRVPQEVYIDFPKLKVLDGILKVQDYANPEVKKLVGQLNVYPSNILTSLKNEGLKEIEIANLTTPYMAGNEDLKGVQPRNWPQGSTWEEVPGAYNPNNKTVVAGAAAKHGSEALLIHETGHAVGDLLGFNNSSEVKSAHKRLYDKLNPYLKGEGAPGNEAGRQELFAEALAVLLEDGESVAIQKFDAEFVGFLKNKVLLSDR